MEKVQVVLLESVGKIKFGMTRKEVREKYEVKGEFIKNGFSNNLTDDLGFCHVYYNDEGKCEAVEIFNDVEVYIGEKLIFPTTCAAAKNVEKSLEQDDEGMLSINMSIGIYAPDGEMESILFGEKGYY
ncbi:hypothetical protein [Eubacterium sp.]